MKYIDPTGQWIDNGDGTYTAEKSDTLWKLYEDEWREKSEYEGDPTKLQPSDVVGKVDSSATSYTGTGVQVGIASLGAPSLNMLKDLLLGGVWWSSTGVRKLHKGEK